MQISGDRCYVLLSVKWCRSGELVFWGRETKDNEPRSFGGYTNDLNTCEKYTFDEARNERHSHYLYNDETLEQMMNVDRSGTWIIHVDDLERLGRKSLVFKY